MRRLLAFIAVLLVIIATGVVWTAVSLNDPFETDEPKKPASTWTISPESKAYNEGDDGRETWGEPSGDSDFFGP